MARTEGIWLIAHINRDYIESAEAELKQYEYTDIQIYIPTVRILKKNFKNKEIFEFIPLLFNYGFFKVPFDKACQVEYLSLLRQRITCIYGWVKDPIKTVTSSPRLRLDNGNFIDALPKAAVASDAEVSRMITASETFSIYNKEDLDRIKPGSYITLAGYPFENMPAKVIKINHKKKEVKVKLLLDTMDSFSQNTIVSFENVFYSVYKNFNEESKEKSYDEMNSKYGENAAQHIFIKGKIEDYG